MKPTFLFLLIFGSLTAGCPAVPTPASKVLLAQADYAKIAQVKAATLKTANASWWGFDKDDATDCLQAAINSGAPKLIVDNTGSDWIINKPLTLVSNQEIDFADGVVIQAKKDCFHGKNECLFSGKNLTNIKLIGAGNATFRMQRADYANPKLYSKSEWRHGIGLWDCNGVVVRGLTVTETGGDGLYLGAGSNGVCKNVLVENCNFDKNYRQGISVISAENLMIRNCRLTNTDGTPPQAGIDFEPNGKGQRLVNCMLENCILTGNTGGGVDIYTVQLDGSSSPISITLSNCTISGNTAIGMASTITRSTTNPAIGTVIVTGCKFDHDKINLRNAIVGSAKYMFKNCTLDFSPTQKSVAAWQNVPIVLATDSQMKDGEIGGISFDHVTVIDDAKQQPIDLSFQGSGRLSGQITGSLFVESNGKATPFDLASFVQEKQAQLEKINAQKPPVLPLDALHAPAAGAARAGNGEFYLRGAFTFLQYAEKGEQITINVTARKVYDRETTVDLIAPDGKKLQTYTIPLNNKPFPITFTADQTGLYRVVRAGSFSQRIDITSANPGNGLLADVPVEFLPLKGRLYFQVPAGVSDFSIGVSTDSTADVALLNPQGEEVQRQNNLGSLHLFSAHRADASQSEIWSLDVSNAVWAVTVNMYAPLTPVVSTNPETLLLK